MNNDKSDPHIELYWHYNTIGLERMIKQPHRTHIAGPTQPCLWGLKYSVNEYKKWSVSSKAIGEMPRARPSYICIRGNDI